MNLTSLKYTPPCHSTWLDYARRLAVLLFVALVTYSEASQTLQGIVLNGTTGAPQSGDLVVVVIGNKELGRTVTADNGHFTITAPPTHAVQGLLSIRVLHAGVTYSHPARFNSPVSIPVYETSPSQEHVNDYMCVLQFQTSDPGELEVTELHAIRNDSWPRRTVVNARNVSLSVPTKAQGLSLMITEADGQGARLSFNGDEIRNAPKSLAVPLEPGLTRYVLNYRLAYDGHFAFERRLQYRTEKLFLMVAPGMQVDAGHALEFRSVEDHTGAQVREADSVAEDFPLTIQLRGNGVLSHAFSSLGSRDKKPVFPLRTESTAPNFVAQNSHAQTTDPTDHNPQSPDRGILEHWSSKWIVLGCTMACLIVAILGKAIYARKARQSI